MLQPGDLAPAFRVQPVFGLPVRTGGSPLVVLFLRSLTSSLARTALVATEAALPRLEVAGARVVAFTRTDLETARDYVPRHHVLVPIVVDSTGTWFDAWGVGRDRGLLRSLAGLRPSTARAALGAVGGVRGLPDSQLDQLPAEFLVGADGRLRYARYGRSVLDVPDLEALCAALV